jgi:hypothetical protein
MHASRAEHNRARCALQASVIGGFVRKHPREHWLFRHKLEPTQTFRTLQKLMLHASALLHVAKQLRTGLTESTANECEDVEGSERQPTKDWFGH